MRAIRIWAKRVAISFFRQAGLLTPAMHLDWLEWLRDDLKPTDPRLPTVLIEIAMAKESCRA